MTFWGIIDIYTCSLRNKRHINYIIIHLLTKNNNKASKEKPKHFNGISKHTEISLNKLRYADEVEEITFLMTPEFKSLSLTLYGKFVKVLLKHCFYSFPMALSLNNASRKHVISHRLNGKWIIMNEKNICASFFLIHQQEGSPLKEELFRICQCTMYNVWYNVDNRSMWTIRDFVTSVWSLAQCY